MAVQLASAQIDYSSDVVTRQRIQDGKIVVLEFDTPYLSCRIVDEIVNVIIDTMRNWTPKRPYLALQIFNKGVMMTPYARQRTEEVVSMFPHLKGRVATVIHPVTSASVTQSWLDNILSVQQPAFAHRIFFTREEALNWLTELL